MGNEFCKECNNMLYPKDDNSENVLMLVCKSCDHIQEATSNKIFASYFKNRNLGFKAYAKDLAKDPTLPKTNAVCKKCNNNVVVYFQNKEYEEEVVFDLIYICVQCYHYWTQ